MKAITCRKITVKIKLIQQDENIAFELINRD